MRPSCGWASTCFRSCTLGVRRRKERRPWIILPNVRPGRYTPPAFADGVLGEYARTDIVVEPGASIDLGALPWRSPRKGRQLWEIGIPNRNSQEFLKGDDYDHDGMQALHVDNEYALLGNNTRSDCGVTHPLLDDSVAPPADRASRPTPQNAAPSADARSLH